MPICLPHNWEWNSLWPTLVLVLSYGHRSRIHHQWRTRGKSPPCFLDTNATGKAGPIRQQKRPVRPDNWFGLRKLSFLRTAERPSGRSKGRLSQTSWVWDPRRGFPLRAFLFRPNISSDALPLARSSGNSIFQRPCSLTRNRSSLRDTDALGWLGEDLRWRCSFRAITGQGPLGPTLKRRTSKRQKK